MESIIPSIKKIFTKDLSISLLIGILIGAALLYIIFLFVSDYRVNSIFTVDSYKCGVIKYLKKNPDLTSFFDSAYSAGAHMHGCGKINYRYDGLDYKLESDGKYWPKLKNI